MLLKTQNRGSPKFQCSALDLTAHHWLARARTVSLQRDYFRRPGRSALCKAVRREGRITSATASLAQGTIGSTAVLSGNVREEKKVPRELSSADGTIGDSRIMLHTVVISS